MALWSLAAAAVPLAWLLANHYPPWLSAWQEGAALVLLALAAGSFPGATALPRPLASFALIAATCAIAQWSVGRMSYLGDVVLVLLYLAALVLALMVGSALVRRDREPGEGSPLVAVACGVLLAAILSVAAAVIQWTGALSLGLWIADLPPGGRPFANVAQPNHLCTVAMLGIVAAGLLLQCGRIGRAGFFCAAAWLLVGMVMSGSRTGSVQLAFAAIMLAVPVHRAYLRIRARDVGALVAGYVALAALWPKFSDLMILSGRNLDDIAQAGTRLKHWQSLLGAIAREPWWGYGWQQISVAQVRGAELSPFVGEHIEHSHNLMLDLLVWSGVPIGLALFGLLLWWFASRIRSCSDGVTCWLLIGVGCLGIHGMLEYPLEYAYFLIPLGFMMGAIEARTPAIVGLSVPAGSRIAATLAFTAVLAAVGWEYFRAEEAHRTLRLESARIGSPGIRTPPPDLHVLTQLEAFLRFAHTEAKPGMSADQVDNMRRVSERFAYPSAMFRYALAAGLNGQPDTASRTLQRLCRMHPRPRCVEGREAWQMAQEKFPTLAGIPPPQLP